MSVVIVAKGLVSRPNSGVVADVVAGGEGRVQCVRITNRRNGAGKWVRSGRLHLIPVEVVVQMVVGASDRKVPICRQVGADVREVALQSRCREAAAGKQVFQLRGDAAEFGVDVVDGRQHVLINAGPADLGSVGAKTRAEAVLHQQGQC